MCKWKNALNQEIMGKARQDILDSFQGKKPRVLDPFAGGGSIPLEALRLGCDVYAIDYNPVAYIIEKCTLEYPQRFGEKLVTDVMTCGKKIFEEVRKELHSFYPPVLVSKNGFKMRTTPIGYIWSRTINCINCNIEIPLFKQFWLSRKKNRKISLIPTIKQGEKHVQFDIVGSNYNKFPEFFNPKVATISRSSVNCPSCDTTINPKVVKDLFQKKKSNEKLIAVVSRDNNIKGKFYTIASETDLEANVRASNYLKQKRKRFITKFQIDPIPHECLSPNRKSVSFGIERFGITKWYELFNPRQQLAFLTFCEKIRDFYIELSRKSINKEYIEAIICCLGLTLDRVCSYNTKFGRWHVTGEKATDLFAIQNIGWVWDYCEINPLSQNFSWSTNLNWVVRYLKHAVKMHSAPAKVNQASATELPFKDCFFDAIFTDPPYYDYINYSNLSDFFFVLLKRSVGYLYPEKFKTELTPKENEIVACNKRHFSKDRAKRFFTEKLTKSFQELSRVLKPEGIIVIVYAHGSIEGWEAFTSALQKSGLYVTKTWPILTEMKGRLTTHKSKVLKSSIYIVARKIRKLEEIEFGHFRQELLKHLKERVTLISKMGILEIDFPLAVIGTSLEITSKYKRVLKNGHQMEVRNLILEAEKMSKDILKSNNILF